MFEQQCNIICMYLELIRVNCLFIWSMSLVTAPAWSDCRTPACSTAALPLQPPALHSIFMSFTTQTKDGSSVAATAPLLLQFTGTTLRANYKYPAVPQLLNTTKLSACEPSVGPLVWCSDSSEPQMIRCVMCYTLQSAAAVLQCSGLCAGCSNVIWRLQSTAVSPPCRQSQPEYRISEPRTWGLRNTGHWTWRE